MSLELQLHTVPDVPVEADVLSVDRFTGLNAAEIEKLTIHHGNQPVPLAEFFSVKGSENGEIHLAGDLSRIKHIGSGMSRGSLYVHGDAGAHLGSAMRGGLILVDGGAGDWVGPELSGGRIEIRGNAGHLAGSAYRGSAVGITGGEIIIHGNARNELGHAMRGGLIAVGGTAGDFTGVNMLAGTIIIMGEAGIRTGAGMKRGSIVLMSGAELLPTFTYACLYHPGYLRMYLMHLKSLGFPVSDEQISGKYARWSGDAVELNRGEILLYKM